MLYAWEFQKGDEFATVRVQGPLTLDDDELMVRSAISGVGLAFVHRTYALEHIANGTLVSVLEDWCNLFPVFISTIPATDITRLYCGCSSNGAIGITNTWPHSGPGRCPDRNGTDQSSMPT